MRNAILGIAALAASACTGNRGQDPSDTIVVERCTGAAIDPYVLGQPTAEGDHLVVPVQTGGGCAEHRFSACWDGFAFSSYPPMLTIHVAHDAGGDTCDAALRFDLRVDLDGVIRPATVRIGGASGQLEGTTNVVSVGP